MHFLDYPDLQKDKTRMEHFVSLYGVLLQFLDDVFIPNEAELLGIYGKVFTVLINFTSN